MTADSDVPDQTAADAATEPLPDAVESPDSTAQEVHFHFPVTVEIIGEADPGLEERIIARVFEVLNDELASRS